MFFVCDLKKYPEELAKNKEYSSRMDSFKEQATFLKKQLENLGKERDKTKDEYFRGLENFAIENKLVPENFNVKTWGMQFNEESNQVFTSENSEKDDHPLIQLLNKL